MGANDANIHRDSRSSVALHLKARLRLLAGLICAGLAWVALRAAGVQDPLGLALAWDFGILVHLAISWTMMLRSTTAHIERRARDSDISLTEIVLLTAVAAAFSLVAAARVLGAAKAQAGSEAGFYLGAGIGTIVLSWIFVHTLFAIHYAHEFHDVDRHAHGKPQAGLNFPGTDKPDYWDFIYFAVVIAMTCQVSDVTIDGRAMRHLVTAHGIISFFLNTVIVALAVGIAASLI